MIKFILTSLILIMPFKFYASTNSSDFHPKVIIFDFGGVMIDFDLQNLLSYIAKEFDMPFDECKGAIKKEINPLGKGDFKEEDFWDYFAKKYSISLPENWELNYKKFIKNSAIPKKEMYELVTSLKEKGFQVSMLSDVTQWQADAFEEMRLYKEFDPVVLSYNIKSLKPDRKSYNAILKKLDLSPEQCLFIDDRIENIEHAEKLGIKSLHFKSSGQLIAELKKLNILF